MTEFWEEKFREEGTSWGFEPSDSAMLIKDFFLAHKAKNILIPGIGYGRNAKIFQDNGFKIEGIEISKAAIEMAKSENRLDIKIYHGSVNDMPFSNIRYDGIFCYALLHLLNNRERKNFIRNCYNQLQPLGYMIFTIISTKSIMYGSGNQISKNRFTLKPGLNVFFFDEKAIESEFKDFGLLDFKEIEEPIKHMKDEPSLNCFLVICQKV